MTRDNNRVAPSTGSEALVQGLKILVADDHHLVREGLKLALRQFDQGVTIVEADTLDNAIAAYRAGDDFDLVLLDLNMPGTSGLMSLDGFERHCPDARVVVISASYDMQTVQTAVRRGVLGFIPKLSGKGTLLSALRFVLAGGIYVPPEMFLNEAGDVQANNTVDTTPSANTLQAIGLTARQVDVLRQLLEGKSNKLICRDLNLAMGTVKGHVAAILHSLGVNTRAEAIAAADRQGWRQLLRSTARQA
ncbi:MAG: response regulator transcription factor [Comamonadaceae bacterium]|nr:MAG: response regulator transcription factor [Comamonadaceae bacterium]